MQKDKKKLISNPIISEWLWEKNATNNLFPDKLPINSNKKAAWKCSICGNEWVAVIANRVKGHGCPECGKKLAVIRRMEKLIEKKGSLIENNPRLAKDWNYNRNGKLLPSQFTSSSNKKVWWMCSNGHEWEATINSRNGGCGCPFCSGRQTEKRKSVAAVQPDLVIEWDTERNKIKPTECSPMSDKKIWWKCRTCGYEWEATVGSRSQGHGCPNCATKKRINSLQRYTIEKSGSIAETHPEIAAEWHPTKNGVVTPYDVSFGSQQIIWWRCKRGHSWQASVSNRIKGRGCPICHSGTQTSFPEQATLFYLKKYFQVESRYKIFNQEVDIYLPTLLTAVEYDGGYYHSTKKAIERDEKKSKILNQKGIKLYRIKESNQNRIVTQTIIEYKYDESYSQLPWAISTLLKILGIVADSKDICIAKDRNNIDEQYLFSIKVNSIVTLIPEIALEWDYDKNGGLLPEYYSANSRRKVWWICKTCGYSWAATIGNRRRGDGCPLCAHKVIIQGYNDLMTKCPEVVLDWDYSKNTSLNPATIAPNSNIDVYWKCHICNYEWKATINNRSQGHGCYKCSKKRAAQKRVEKIIAEKGSLAECFPDLAQEWNIGRNNGILPSKVTVSSSKEIWWVCRKCGHEWKARVYSRTRGHGCPQCARKTKG